MTLKQLIRLEDKAKEVWVISPGLHYDTENKVFSELVSVNLGQKTKYRYIVPASSVIEKNLKRYQTLYNVSDKEIAQNFLFLPPSDFMPFVMETAIYDASSSCIACAAPALEDSTEVIKFSPKASKQMAKEFKALWKKYKRSNP